MFAPSIVTIRLAILKSLMTRNEPKTVDLSQVSDIASNTNNENYVDY